jgi:hypothetical protein
LLNHFARVIYENPQCVALDTCVPSTVTSFFDLTRSTAGVNAQLESQQFSVPSGTYNYIRMEFCNGSPSDQSVPDGDTVQFTAGSMSAPYSYPIQACGITAQITPPIVVSSGQNVIVTVAYDLSNTVTYTTDGFGSVNCTSGSPAYCFTPTFTPYALIIS